MIRVSRGCYDKFHRCPGWAGGGWKYAKKTHCRGGMLSWHDISERWAAKWRFTRCSVCGVYVLPRVLNWFDPSWVKHHIWYLLEERREARRWKREQ